VCFARRQGFYKTCLPLKALGTGLALMAAIGLQYRYGLPVMLTTVLDCVMVSFMGVLWRFVIPSGVPGSAAGTEAGPVHPGPGPRLWYPSGQDREIAERIAAGEKYELIAQTLGLSVRSFNRRVKGLFVELGVKNRADFVRWYKASP
jgi:DNA-binding CsgD family transcriptional regulator